MSRTEQAHPFRLREEDLDANPFQQFQRWFREAEAAQVPQPEAVTLATATADGKPSARMVLLRGCDERGFCFFTNYYSRKGTELTANPVAALVFYWQPLDRQVRIEGRVEQTTSEESDRYFQARPRNSQLGAWASEQSQIIAGRALLDRSFEEMAVRYREGRVPRPPHWGGFRVVPDTVEFWQGGLDRLHDRLRYRRSGGSGWIVERLAP
jgi:pyridoxamine 5'-phosphate oxidase